MFRSTDHRLLFAAIAALFITLTIVVAIRPALDNQRSSVALTTAQPMSAQERAGERVFIAEGCIACHTQQVRSVAMDRVWGERPGIPADYATATRQDVWHNATTLMGTERTGPDLTNIGLRQPSREWHYLHLFAPRRVVPASIMPSYPWLFRQEGGKVVPTQEAQDLVAYLLSRKQAALPTGMTAEPYRMGTATTSTAPRSASGLDGKTLYTQNCEACHQANGKGLPGAFPPLAGSATVNGDDIDLYVAIIMRGVDRLPDYAVMPAIGSINGLTAEQIAAIIDHERSSWGNHAPPVSVERVRAALKKLPPQP
jgi:cytochrome c oxidase cbb3-type subunit 2